MVKEARTKIPDIVTNGFFGVIEKIRKTMSLYKKYRGR
jgi:hypothetical protein